MGPRLIIVSNRVASPSRAQATGRRTRGRREGGAERPHRHLVRLERQNRRDQTAGRAPISSASRSATPSSTSPTPISRNITTASPIACCGRSCIIASTCRNIRAPTSPATCGSTAFRRPARRDYRGRRRRLGARLSSVAVGARTARARPDNPIGFFLHIPCAPPDILQTLPHHEEILGSLIYYDLVGFQTENDRDNFRRLSAVAGAQARAAATPSRSTAARRASAPSRSASRPRSTPASRATWRARASCASRRQPQRACSCCSASTGSTIPRELSSASTPSIASWRSIRSGAHASLSCRSRPRAAPKSRNTPTSRTR